MNTENRIRDQFAESVQTKQEVQLLTIPCLCDGIDTLLPGEEK